MKRFGANCVITLYLGALAWGIVAHTIKFSVQSHPGMYFVVWDMFCGWGAYSVRTQLIAEGESGRYYEVAPAPWGELRPFGSVERRHYDTFHNLSAAMIRNNLRQSEHEPITRVFVVEELWPKQYNVPDHLWSAHSNIRKDLKKYYSLRAVCDGNGELITAYPTWYSQQVAHSVASNPRLQAAARSARPFFTVTHRDRDRQGAASNAAPYTPRAN